MEMDWTPDFCLACDRQTSGGAYCSQSCRLADLENSSNGSEPASPSTPNGIGSWSSRTFTTLRNPPSGFYLPPPINFDAYKARLTHNTPSPTALHPCLQPSKPSYFASISLSQFGPTPKATTRETRSSLTTSSSQSSLSSLQSSAYTPDDSHLSEHARNELRNYANSFDRARHWKRRITL